MNILANHFFGIYWTFFVKCLALIKLLEVPHISLLWERLANTTRIKFVYTVWWYSIER